eukprot:16445151-Heterocapsa_arctica.AAC.1
MANAKPEAVPASRGRPREVPSPGRTAARGTAFLSIACAMPQTAAPCAGRAPEPKRLRTDN